MKFAEMFYSLKKAENSFGFFCFYIIFTSFLPDKLA